ncbi:MAG: NAD(P)-binding domain-containing protein [Verrucomicrobia bacterium]|nr:NAD(P)-binding domain-containing protein [Verrucomicrobiota bacterium]
MNIGIIGSGNVGTGLAKLLGAAGHKIMLSFSRSGQVGSNRQEIRSHAWHGRGSGRVRGSCGSSDTLHGEQGCSGSSWFSD